MALLSFTAAGVAAQIAHARGPSTFLPNWNGPVGKPALILIVGTGVHLPLNSIDGTTTRVVTTAREDPSDVSADDVQMLIDRGHNTIRPATDGIRFASLHAKPPTT